MTNGISAMGYPQNFYAQTYPTGQGQAYLNQQYANDYGFAQTPVYDLPMDVNMGYGFPGYGGGGGGMGMGYGMGMGMGMMPRYSQAYLNYINMDYKDRLAYDHQYNQDAREYNFLETRGAQQYSALQDGQTGNISMTCRALQNAIREGDTDQISAQFNRIVTSLKATPIYDKLKQEGAYTESEIDLQLRETAFRQFQAATGQDISEMVDADCDGNIANGFFNTLSFGNAQKNSKEEIISKLYGKEPPAKTQIEKAAGKTAGVLTYAATGTGIGFMIGGLVGAVAGGIVGTVMGVVGALC